jgi:hypothetical protein
MIDVPTGAVTLKPSISSVTVCVAALAGVPKSFSLFMLMVVSSGYSGFYSMCVIYMLYFSPIFKFLFLKY